MAILKFFHVLFVFLWMGSLLSLTRLLTYQVKEEGSLQLKLGRILKRMYFVIDLPAMVLAVALGLALLFLKGVDWKAPWFHLKLTCVFFLIVCDLICGWQIVKRSRKALQGRGVGYQILHGVAGLLLIGILVAIYILKNAHSA